jgi:hypothetical protein
MSDPQKKSLLEMEKVFYMRESGIGDSYVKTMHVFVVDKLTDEQKQNLVAAETLLLELAEDASEEAHQIYARARKPSESLRS